jgi:hypothetical protein
MRQFHLAKSNRRRARDLISILEFLEITLIASGLPSALRFHRNFDGTAEIYGTPGWFDAGRFVVDVTAEDNGMPVTRQSPITSLNYTGY